MAHIIEAPPWWDGAISPRLASAPIISHPAAHEAAVGVKTLDPNVITAFYLTWIGISNPNPQTAIRVAVEGRQARQVVCPDDCAVHTLDHWVPPTARP